MEKQGTIGQIDFSHWLLRLIAYIIDGIIVLIPTFIIYHFIIAPALTPTYTVFGFYTYYGAVPWWGLWLISPAIFGILSVAYFAIFETAWSATIGKRLLGFKVQTTNGNKLTIGKAIMRNISKIYWILLVLDWLLGAFTQGNDKRQKYTDRLAGTTVAVAKQPFSSSSLPPPPPPPKPNP
jgi:uncharacterized RDD family membrane protein YckC